MHLTSGHADHGLTHLATVHRRHIGEEDEADYHECAKEVAEEHHDPVLPDCRPLDAFACGGHHDHGIAREEFGARNHYQNKAKAEQESAEYALNSEGQCWVTNHER